MAFNTPWICIFFFFSLKKIEFLDPMCIIKIQDFSHQTKTIVT